MNTAQLMPNKAKAAQLDALLTQGDSYRRSNQWLQAEPCYAQVVQHEPEHWVARHNLALCLFALGRYEQAAQHAYAVVQKQGQQWQTALVLIKSLVKLGAKSQALQFLNQLIKQIDLPPIRLELATLTLQHGCDARAARAWAAPLVNDPQCARDALITQLIAQLYDRDAHLTPEQVNQQLIAFAQEHMPAPELTQPDPAWLTQVPKRRSSKSRKRVGLLSIQFHASPVYYMAYGALKHLAQQVDLVFFARNTKSDWAAQAFASIASDWVDVTALNAGQLASLLKHYKLDSLIDLSGWMDPVGLQALAAKPVPKQLKWVGGQSCTTGLSCFDGFVSDWQQTPQGTEALYTEPLIRLPHSYVSYSPPPYMPLPRLNKSKAVLLGVMANPTKLSVAFLQTLNALGAQWAKQKTPYKLTLFDKRYQQSDLVQRIRAQLPNIDVHFETPKTHADFLNAIADLDAVIDAYPYSGGLTAIEALSLGVPTYTQGGLLFCERHCLAHAHYAELDADHYRFERLSKLSALKRRKLYTWVIHNQERHHLQLANSLLAYL